METDSSGKPPSFFPGDRVYVHPMRQEATVIRQQLHWDYPESFWGNLELQYDDGIKGISHSWQCKKVNSLEKAIEHMSDKGYEVGSLEDPEFKEIQQRHHSLWDNWKASRDIT